MTPDLAALAACYGVATEYWDQAGRHHDVAATTVVAVLAALGVDAGSSHAITVALEDARLAPWRRTLPPVFVTREGLSPTCRVHVPHGSDVRLSIELEDGGPGPAPVQLAHMVAPVEVDGRLIGEALFQLPAGLPTGWHRLVATMAAGASVDCALVVTPQQLVTPAHAGWGFAVQLYSIRSRRSWGLGDLADLADLAAWSGAELGADFVQVNPVHAAAPVAPIEPSPYLPVSRRFVSPLYVRVEAIPEHAYLAELDRRGVAELAAGPLAASRTSELLDRESAWTAKREALLKVHAVSLTPGRRAAYRAYCRREGEGLEDFATWCALVEDQGPMTGWRPELLDPRSATVMAERDRLSARVEFHRWCQWVLDEQLGAAHAAALDAGMAIGIVHDLAVGVHPEGADAWALGDVLARGVTVGAPPDMYNQLGQDWSQPPWSLQRLAEAGFAPYRDMLRTVLRHAGGVRVDHVLGLFRLWWIPEGHPPAEGTYVTYDHEALVGILALEAQRAGAIVIGEDLGTVEQWVKDSLAHRGVLGTSILWFEREPGGAIRPPDAWRADCLAAVTTHDLPPTAGYLRGEHIKIRGDLGLLVRPVAEERREHEHELAAWREMLIGLGLLGPEASAHQFVVALHRFLGRTPARLCAVSLVDAVGDRRTQNQPGTHGEYPNWRMPVTDGLGRPVLLEDLPEIDGLRDIVQALARS